MSQAQEPLMPHPDHVIGGALPLSRFTINTEQIDIPKKDCDLRLAALQEKMDKIARTFVLTGRNGQPFEVIPEIAKISRDKEELKGVARGLDRYADHVETYDKLKAKVDILNMVADDPNFLAWALGDFGDDLEQELDKLLKDNDIE